MEEIKGKTFSDIFPEVDAKRMADFDRKVLETDSIIKLVHPMTFQENKESWWRNIKFPIHTPAGETLFGGLSIDITAQRNTRKKLEESLREKEVLMRELYHRTKNNMQLINSLITLQSNFVQSKKLLHSFRNIKDRITAMALVHQKLLQTRTYRMST